MTLDRVTLDQFNTIPAQDPAQEAERHTWHPINLADLAEQEPVTPAPLGLYYPGKRHLWSGEPESAKSWAALIASAQEIQAGRHAMYIDFESDPHEMKERLDHLGVEETSLPYFVYIRPSEPINHPGVKDTLALLLAMYQPAIVTIDAYAGALDIHELDPYKTADIERFHRAVVEPLRVKGAAVIILDHVVKNKENRGKFSIGSERKVGSVDVHLQFDTITPFGRGRKGLFTIRVPKDRPGWLNRPAGTLELVSDPDTHRITWQIKHAQPADSGDDFRPTTLMERVSRYLEDRDHAVTQRTIEQDVTGKAAYIRKAIDALVHDGYAHRETAAHNQHLLSSNKPYRAGLDPQIVPRPECVPDRPGTRPIPPQSPDRPPPPPRSGAGTNWTGVGDAKDAPQENQIVPDQNVPRPDAGYDSDIPF